jgi:hypothetical protein
LPPAEEVRRSGTYRSSVDEGAGEARFQGFAGFKIQGKSKSRCFTVARIRRV